MNVNGWTELNASLRAEILQKINADSICVTETHLTGDNTTELDGYKWFDVI